MYLRLLGSSKRRFLDTENKGSTALETSVIVYQSNWPNIRRGLNLYVVDRFVFVKNLHQLHELPLRGDTVTVWCQACVFTGFLIPYSLKEFRQHNAISACC